MMEKHMTKSEFAKKIGVSPSFVTRHIEAGHIKEHDGKVDFEDAVCSLFSVVAFGKKNGNTKIKLPDSTVSLDTLIVIEAFSDEKGIPFGKALELLLLESNTFNLKMDSIKY